MASNNIEVLDPTATVEKLRKFVSGVELNRRHFMAALGVAGVAAGTGLVSGPVARAQQPTPNGYTQSDVLNFLLNVMYLKATFYSFVTQGADLPGPSYITLNSSTVYNQPSKVTFTGTNASQITDMFNEMYYDDVNQLINLRDLIETTSGAALGSAAAAAVVAPRPTLNLMGTSGNSGTFSAPSATTVITGAQAIAMARMFEDLSVTAFAGALQYLSGANLAAAAQIMAVYGCHASALRLTTIQTGAPYQGTFYVGPSFQIATTTGSNKLFMPSTGIVTTNGVTHPAVGDAITGFGIPVGATVTSIANIGLGNLAPTCYSTAGSPILTVITNVTGILPNMTITGTNIPPFTYVLSATPTAITMSQNATATSVEVPYGVFTAGSALITTISSVTGLVAGRAVSAPGYLPANPPFPAAPTCVISSASGAIGTITVLLNTPALASSVVTVTGTIAAGSNQITLTGTSTLAGVIPANGVPSTQPVIAGTLAAPVSGIFPAAGATVTSVSTSPSPPFVISLSSPSLAAYSGTFTIPSAVNITVTSTTTETVAIGQANITISEPATATGTGTAVILPPASDSYQLDPDEVAPVDPGTAALAIAGPAPATFNTPTSLTPGLNQGFFATAGSGNASGVTPAGFAFARTFSQVLGVLYANTTPGTYVGGYFPAAQPNGDSTNTFGGVSGTIAVV